MPDPFVLAILLTLLTAALALTLGFRGSSVAAGDAAGPASRAEALLAAWRGDSGIWKLLGFSMQMCLVLVSGHALAAAPPIRRGLERLAALPRTTRSAAAMVGFTCCAAAVVNWGLGLIVGAVLAREVGRAFARRGAALHYPLVCAAGYTCMMIWHGGLSGSAPLSVTTREAAARTMPAALADRLIGEGIPLGATLLSPLNIMVTCGLLLIVPACLALLAPRDGALETEAPPRGVLGDAGVPGGAGEPVRDPSGATDAGGDSSGLPAWLERSPLLAWTLAIALALGAARFVSVSGAMSIGLNEVNAAMIALGLVLHGSPTRWMRAVEDGASGCAGIIVQFPLYAGIMAMLLASGLVATFANAMNALGTPRTVPVLSFLAACIINIFIPSGGGQWAVQGPIALEAGRSLGIPAGVMVMTVAYGDQLTNMLQPFWAIPLLAITRVKASAIVGYTTIVMIVGGAWIVGVLLVMG